MQIYILILAGMAGGLMGGMGMGGGTLLIPILTLLVGFEQAQAQAINLISFVPMAIVSLIILIKNKLIDYKTLAICTPLAIVGCCVGAWATARIEGAVLARVFGIFIFSIGAIFLIKTIFQKIYTMVDPRKQKKAPKNSKKTILKDKFREYN